MNDVIYYKNGEETFRISPPTAGTKCPETKLEVKKMDEPITLNLTLKELQQIDKYVEMNDDTLPLIIKIENAYPPRKSAIEEAYKEWMSDVEFPAVVVYALEKDCDRLGEFGNLLCDFVSLNEFSPSGTPDELEHDTSPVGGILL